MLFVFGDKRKKWKSRGKRKRSRPLRGRKGRPSEPGTPPPFRGHGNRLDYPTPSNTFNVHEEHGHRQHHRLGWIDRQHWEAAHDRGMLTPPSSGRQRPAVDVEDADYRDVRQRLEFEELAEELQDEIIAEEEVLAEAERLDEVGTPASGGLAIGHTGPFNTIGAAYDATDKAAQLHDLRYGKLGLKSYFTFNAADEKYLKDLEKVDLDLRSALGKGYFNVKKVLAPHDMGYSGPIRKKKVMSKEHGPHGKKHFIHEKVREEYTEID